MIDLGKLTDRAHDDPRRGRRGRGVWSPRTTLAYCWRSRTVAAPRTLARRLALAARHRPGHPQHPERDRPGATLVWAALWALMSRRPAPAHVLIVTLGGWLLLAPSLWYFGAAAASWNSIATGLAVPALSASVLVTGPWTRPPVDADATGGRPGEDLPRRGR